MSFLSAVKSNSQNQGDVDSLMKVQEEFNRGNSQLTSLVRAEDQELRTNIRVLETKRAEKSDIVDKIQEEISEAGDSVETQVEEASSNGEMQRVKSVGDMITELQRGAESPHIQKKKSLTSRPASRSATGLESWTPFPQLNQDASTSSPNCHHSPGVSSPATDDSCLTSLRVEDARLCRQIHEMGFPLPRVVKGISAVGPDSQKLIDFCLNFDRYPYPPYSEFSTIFVQVG